MTANELFHAGRLRDAIDTQTQKVRANPTDNPARFFLLELFLFAGEIDRVRKQLDVLRYDDPQHTAAVAQYRQALDSEELRRAVFAGTAEPKGLENAPDHVRLRFEALPYLARGEQAEARQKLDEANAAVPTLAGLVNGKPVEGIFDGDERFGTVLEVFGTGGLYTWVPLERVTEITMNPPKSPRDVVWRPAQVVLTDGIEGDVLLPGLYPNSHDHIEEEIKLGRSTEWVGAEGEVTRGLGSRVMLINGAMMPFGTIHQICPSIPAG